MNERDLFWKRLEDVTAGMLGCEPDWRLVPMSHHTDPDGAALWFITAAGTDLTDALSGGPQKAVHAVSSQGGKLYARIEGQLELSNDEAKLDEVWNAIASSWFENGKRDDDVRLLKLTLQSAEVWTTEGGVAFFYQIAKSKLTGSKPDMGDHFEVDFA